MTEITARDIAEAITEQDDDRHGSQQAYFSRSPDDLGMKNFFFDGDMDLFAVAKILNRKLNERSNL